MMGMMGETQEVESRVRPIPPHILLAINAAAGLRDLGYNVRFLRAVEAHGLVLVRQDVAMRMAALGTLPLPAIDVPMPVYAEPMTLTFAFDSFLAWAQDVPRHRRS